MSCVWEKIPHKTSDSILTYEKTILYVVLTKDPVAEGDGHSVADQHLGGRHHSQVGDVHKHVEDGHQGDCDA